MSTLGGLGMLTTLLRLYFLWSGLRQVQRTFFGDGPSRRKRQSSDRSPSHQRHVATVGRGDLEPVAARVKAPRKSPTKKAQKRPRKVAASKPPRTRRKK